MHQQSLGLDSRSTFDHDARSAEFLKVSLENTHLTWDLSTVVPGAMREGTTTATSSEEARVSRTTPKLQLALRYAHHGLPHLHQPDHTSQERRT